MKKFALILTVVFITSLLGGCSVFGNEFPKAEALLAEIRDVDIQHNDMTDFLPQKVDDIKIVTLSEQFQRNEQRGKQDKTLMNDLKKELGKSQQSNQYKLQYLSKLLKKTDTIQTKIPNVEKSFQTNATDTLQTLNKQYKTEQQHITYYITQDNNLIKYLESKIEGKTPQPLQDNKPPVNRGVTRLLQSMVDNQIKNYTSKLEKEKNPEGGFQSRKWKLG
jgi:hypothetical protein